MDLDEFNSALEVLRPGLGADGFEIRVDTVRGDSDVRVVLEAKPGACLVCLVPDNLMMQIIENAIRDKFPSLPELQVELLKLGFEDLTDTEHT